MTITDEMVERGREALKAVKIKGIRVRFTDEYADAMARAALAAALPLIEREVREECAIVAEDLPKMLPLSTYTHDTIAGGTGRAIAAAIREAKP